MAIECGSEKLHEERIKVALENMPADGRIEEMAARFKAISRRGLKFCLRWRAESCAWST